MCDLAWPIKSRCSEQSHCDRLNPAGNFLARLLIETHPLTVAQLIDPASAVFDVHENVVATSVRPDKAEATVGIKKFHGSGSHAFPLRELSRDAAQNGLTFLHQRRLPSPHLSARRKEGN
jgi:hypothetical protein